MRRMATVFLLSSLQAPYVAIAQASTLYNQADYSYIDARERMADDQGGIVRANRLEPASA